MAFIEPVHRNKPNITYLLTHYVSLYLAENILIMLYGKIKTYMMIQLASDTIFHLTWGWLCMDLLVNVLQYGTCIKPNIFTIIWV